MKVHNTNARIEALSRYNIMDSEHDVEFDDFIKMIVRISKVSMATIAFADEERVWFKARHGTDKDQIPRENALCNHTIAKNQLIMVQDIQKDELFSYHEMAKAGFRFYASLPLRSKTSGHVLGTICLLDKKAGLLTEDQIELLQIIANQIVGFLEIRDIVRHQKEQRDEFELISNNIGDVVWMMDPVTNKIIYVSKSYERVWERSHEHLTSGKKTLLDGVHPEDYEKVRGAILLQKDFNLEDNYRIVTPEGEEKWIYQRSFVVKDENGEIYRIVGLSSDITAKKKIEETLKVQKEKFEIIVNNIPLILTLYNQDMSYEWINQTFVDKFGWTVEELNKKNAFEKILHSKEEKKKAVDHMSKADGTKWVEFYSKKKNGEDITTSWINVRLSSGQCIGIGQDITQQKKIEDLLKEQQIKMVNTAKLSSLGEMAAGVAHEINNPLTIIMGNVQIIKHLSNQTDPDPKALKDISDTIQNTVNRIAKIINGLKNFARDGGSEPFEKENLLHIIQETLSFCEARFRNNGVKLEIECSEQEIYLDCRQIQISQVILNLLNNSFDAVQSNFDKWVRLKVTQDATTVTLTFQDSGLGIPVDLQEKIMQPFFTTKIVGKGTGLGLSISRGLIEAHGGSLVLDRENKNTTFIITIPKNRKL